MDSGTDFLNKFLSKKVCLDKHNKCAFKEPYSELQYFETIFSNLGPIGPCVIKSALSVSTTASISD